MDKKGVLLPDELDKVLLDNRLFIEAIGIFQLQAWMDWLIMHTQRGVKKEEVLRAVVGYESNYQW